MVEEDKTETDKQEETLSVKTGEIPLQVSFHAQTSFLFKIALKAPSVFAIITKEVMHLLARMSDNWP